MSDKYCDRDVEQLPVTEAVWKQLPQYLSSFDASIDNIIESSNAVIITSMHFIWA
jgi:hypothetical protein